MKKILLGLGSLAVVLVVMPMFAAFEAHVVNVTAQIENALSVPLDSIDFGTVFPQEHLNKPLDISLSASFLAEDRVDDVEYFIRQKPKCALTNEAGTEIIGPTWTGHVVPTRANDRGYIIDCESDRPEDVQQRDDPEFYLLPSLCEYLSKEGDHEGELEFGDTGNDSNTPSFHTPWRIIPDDSQAGGHVEWLDTPGRLAKSDNDTVDDWIIDLAVPCFGSQCAQDWESFVGSINPEANPEDFVQPTENEHKIFGCNLWVEVGGISLPGIGCEEEIDMMLVLDRSGSVAGDLTTLKDAANAFVTALAPSADGNHIGQSSFSTLATLDEHLTGVEADVHAAINALVSSGFTNLADGIDLATGELDDTHVAHERPSVDDVMVIITDGDPNRPNGDTALDKAAAKAEADAARAAGIEVFVIGVGSGVDAAFLMNDIADSPSHYFSAADFENLEDILVDLTQCELPI